MINFQEEIKRFKPSLDVDDIEKAIADADLTDMNDVMMQLIGNASRPAAGFGMARSETPDEIPS